MLLNDDIYGEEEINEQVLIELINSKAVQRLKGISQMGMPKEYWHYAVFSRYEHSIGVLILLRRLGACIEEQIAGLLHDVSHTAFSHVVDWVLGDATKEDYQDRIHKEVVQKSDIPFILKKYGFDYEKVSDIEAFSLLERSAPFLCVDRVDYTLREEFANGRKIEPIICFNHLINVEGKLMFDDLAVAKTFFDIYVNLQNKHWAGIEARARYHILAQVLKNALNLGIVSEQDLMRDDKFVLDILYDSRDEDILEGLDLLKKGFKVSESDKGVELKKKFRYVDPEILAEGKVFTVSSAFPDCGLIIEKGKKEKDMWLKILIKKI